MPELASFGGAAQRLKGSWWPKRVLHGPGAADSRPEARASHGDVARLAALMDGTRLAQSLQPGREPYGSVGSIEIH